VTTGGPTSVAWIGGITVGSSIVLPYIDSFESHSYNPLSTESEGYPPGLRVNEDPEGRLEAGREG
jgi:hypothetical protein